MTGSIRALPFDQWPETHRKLYSLASSIYGVAEGSGMAAHWSDGTHRAVKQRWGLWLGSLKRNCWLDPIELPADTIKLDRLTAYLGELEPLAINTILTCVRDMSEAVRVMQPGVDRPLLRQLVSELQSIAKPPEDKTTCHIGPTDLYDAGLRRMSSHQESAFKHWRPALAYGDGLMMAIWPCKPVRLRTFACTRISVNLKIKNDCYDLEYSAADVKTRARVEAPLPLELTPRIELWRKIVKDVLNPVDPKAMWVTHQGRPMSARQVYQRFCDATTEEVLQRINPHRVRRIVATGISLHAPDQMDLAPTVLDHEQSATTRNSYVRQGNVINNLNYLQILERRRSRISANKG